MGGNLIKLNGYDGKRLELEEYNKVVDYIFSVFKKLSLYPHLYLGIPKTIKNKTSFGDLDILIAPEEKYGTNARKTIKSELTNLLKEDGKETEFFDNGDCSSFPLDNFQIDLIFCGEHSFNFHLNYLSHGDGGNLIGMFSNRNKFKLSQTGLYYEIKADDYTLLKEVCITKSWHEMLDFFDLDIHKWTVGFENADELFVFLTSSCVFQMEWFNPKDFNHEKRDREKKRPIFSSFYGWLEKNYKPKNITPLSKDEWIQRVDSVFGIDLNPIIEHSISNYNESKRLKKYFSEKLEEKGWTNEEKAVKIPTFKKSHNWPAGFYWKDEKTILDYLNLHLT